MLKLIGATALLSGMAYMCYDTKQETYIHVPEVHFLSEQQTRHLLLIDFDNFGLTLNPVNIRANGEDNINDLLGKWATSSTSWTDLQKSKIRQAIDQVQTSLAFSKTFKDQMNTIDWNIAATIYPYYLQGLPHTRGDIIFLTDKLVSTYSISQLASILVHEKTHVWQRKFPEKMEQWMKTNGFERIGKADSLERANPDNDGQIYKNENGQQLGVRFITAQPKDMNDVAYSEQSDHPYEQFASQVQHRGGL